MPSLSDTLRLPSSAFANLGPLLPPTCTVLKDGLSTVAKVILPLVSCFTSRFLPAIISTVLPALMDSPAVVTVLPVFLVPSVVALAFNVKAALFTALTTESTVAILPVLPSFTFTVPAASPVLTDSISPVITFNPSSPVVIVLPSVLTTRPASVVFKDLSPGFTLTPSLPTVKDLSAALTSNLTFAPFGVMIFSTSLPFSLTVFFTSCCTVTVTFVPSPLVKLI